ncbi:MAG TPA: dihydroorotate dehydrogenase electron transfer subunit [Clostridia bacterium]|nr:dihydroorotate dehydrogenase electron transfer subunit [Clostridia bacterium]
MKKELLTVISNEKLNGDNYVLMLSDASYMKPGQFVEICLPGFTLRRPFSVSDYENGILQVVYKVVGRGTEYMVSLKKGDKVDTLTGLGNGFTISPNAKTHVLVGGGIGIAPLYYLAKELHKKDLKTKVILCARSKNDLFFIEEFKKWGEVIVATDDGSVGVYGNAITALENQISSDDYYYACGPEPMLRAICKKYPNGEHSLEAIMGCGFGACMGCTIKTKQGFKRVCKEGPVFKATDIFID